MEATAAPREDDVAACNLPSFPGANRTSTDIAYEPVNASLPLPPDSVIDSAWCVTLHLYTGLDRVCFQLESSGAGEILGTKTCEISGDEPLKTIVARLKPKTGRQTTQQRQCNTAVALDTRSGSDEAAENSAVPPSLHPGIQVALRITASACKVMYRLSFISSAEARNLAATFGHVLSILADDDATLKTIRDISISQRDLGQISAWNGSDLVSQTDLLIHEKFARVAESQPNAEAIDSWDGRMSYSQLHETSSEVGTRLQRAGVGPSSWVLFCFHKSRWGVISMLAILKAGASCVPLDPRHPEHRVRQIIQTSGAKHALVGSPDTAALLARADSTVHVIDVTRPEPTEGSSSRTERHRHRHWPKRPTSSPAFALFTSGSTGNPKGIIATHAGICTSTWAYSVHIGADAKTRILQFSSYTFDVCTADVFTALLHGAALCIPSEADRTDSLQDYIVRRRPTWAALTPTVARLLDPAVAGQAITKLLLVGEPVKESDTDGWIDAGVEVYNVYGPAEVTLITTAARTVKGRASNVGYGVNTRTWVADTTKERLVPVGAVGELVLEGPHVAPGYLNDPENTAKGFLWDLGWIPDPKPSRSCYPRRFYRSGDLVRYCEDGSLQCIGRADAQVKVGGQRVELGDIESHIQAYPETQNAVVLVPRAGPLRDRLTAVLQVSGAEMNGRESSSTSPFTPCDPTLAAEATSNLRTILPPYMVPSLWIGISRFPTSTSGKLDRKTLLAELEALSLQEYAHLVGDASDDELGVPGRERGEIDMNTPLGLLRHVCSQVLNMPVEKASATKSFLRLGGDSITAMQVSAMLRRVGSKTIGVKDLLSCPSLAEASGRVADLAYSQIQLPVVTPGKRVPLSPIQRLFVKTAESSSAWNHYHQSVLMRLSEPREPQDVEHAMTELTTRHAMLRARFERLRSGEWVQYILPECDSPICFEVYPEVTAEKDREAITLLARRGLDITNGPILRAQLFGGKQGTDMLLFIVVHHMVVDLVSWRIMLEEVELQLSSAPPNTPDGQAPLFASYPQTVPFLAWSELQSQMAQQLVPARALPSYHPVPAADFAFWGIPASRNVYADVKETRMSLGETITQNVLYDCHLSLRTEPVDIFLAAIFVSFKRAFPDRPMPAVFNEGHGREPWDHQLDLSRTVGWFTTMFPVCVGEISGANDVADVVRRVKDWRRGSASNGFQYFSTKYLSEAGRGVFGNDIPAEIMFNYEGRYQALEKQASLLKPESWTAGEALADQAPQLQRFCLFEISAAILPDGELHFTSAWNTRARHQGRIALWLTSLLPAAVGKIAATLTLSEPQFTLSDLQQAGVSEYSEADAITRSVLTIPGVESVDDVEDIYPGSPMQDSLALSQSKADDGAYEIEFTWEVTSGGGESSPDVERLVAAWADTVAQHAALRTVVLEAIAGTTLAGMLLQVVLRHHRPQFALLQARCSQHARELLSSYPSYRERGVLLDKKPPHRLLVCSTLDGRVFVRLQINHIVFDGMSTTPLLRDLSRAYGERSQKAGGPGSRPGRRTAFADFIRYVRDQPRRESSVAYWKSFLGGAQPCMFPTLIDTALRGGAEEANRKGARGTVPVRVPLEPAELHGALFKLEVTLPTLFQVVWALVLRMYTTSTQSVFGYLVSGRDAPIDGIEAAVGSFLAMLVGFVDFEQVGKQHDVAHILKRVQQQSAESISHQAVSLAEIQSGLNVSGNSLLFNSGLSFVPMLSKHAQLSQGAALIFDHVSTSDPTEFDLSLIVETGEHNGGIALHLDYRASAIGDGHAANIAETITHVLSEVIRSPFRTADEIANVSRQDMDRILGWNKALIDPLDVCIHDIFASKVSEHPDKEAVYSWDGSLSYKELDDLSTRLAKHLVELGVVPEKMVPVCFEKSMWAVVAILGVLKAGGCFVLLDPSHPDTRLWGIVDEVEASILLCSPSTNVSKGLTAAAEARARKMGILEIEPAMIDSLPALQGSGSGTAVCTSVRPENSMYVVYTSGTTGTPKGIVCSHRAVATGLGKHAEACGMLWIGAGLRSLQFASYSFDASIGDILTTILAGGCICMPCEDDRNPADVAAFIARSRVNWAGITPSFASLLHPPSVPTLRVLCMAGEPLPASQVDAWVDRVKLINMYGPSECTIACVANQHVTRQTPASNIGRGYRAATWIVDENDHTRLRPVGAIGELLIEGPVLARGYLKRPEQTARVFIQAPPWLQSLRPNSRLYKTGDLVRYNADGTICYVARKDTQVKIHGQRVEIGEIEQALRSTLDPADGPVVVDLLKRQHLDETDLLTAFVCVGQDSRDDAAVDNDLESDGRRSIIAYAQPSLNKFQTIVSNMLSSRSAASSLPRFMMPQAFVPLERMPLTSSGKVDRRTLQQVCAGLDRGTLVGFAAALQQPSVASDEADESAEDGSSQERQLARLWEKVLKVKGVGKHSNFFRLGGDSIAAIALRSEARRAGLAISVADIFANPGLADMSKLLLSGSTITSSSSASLSTPRTSAATDLTSPASPPEEARMVPPFSLLQGKGLSKISELDEVAIDCGISLDAIEDLFPCTPMQEGLMALSSHRERQGAYALHAPFKLPPDMDRVRFRSAWEKVTLSNSILRSRIVTRPHGSLVVVTHGAVPVVQVSASTLEAYLEAERKQAFGYGSPLLRLGMVHDQTEGCHYFVLGAHHAIYDGWSMELIWDAVLETYRSGIAPQSGPSFQAFVEQLDQAVQPRISKEFWASALSDDGQDGFPFPMVPASHKPVARSSSSFRFPFRPESTVEMGATLATLAQAAWAITISQYTASSTVTFGVTLSGRDSLMQGVEQVVGPTVVTVPRQLLVRSDQSIPDFVRYVQDVSAAAVPHQHLGLHRIQALGPAAKRACNFGSLFVVNPGPSGLQSALQAAGIVPVPVDSADLHPYPLGVECSPDGQSLKVNVAFDPDCIDEPMVGPVVYQFSHALQAICRSASEYRPFGVAGLMSEVALSHLDAVLGWNNSKDLPDAATARCVHLMVQDEARKHPDKTAVVAEDATLSYRDLDQHADRLSHTIRDLRQANHNAPFVGVCFDKSAAAVVALLAILKAGYAFMPLNPSQPPARLEGLIRQADAKLVLTSDTYRDMLASLHVECRVLPVDMSLLVGNDRDCLARQESAASVKANQPAYMLFTSGSTGVPKGVVMEHGAWACGVASQVSLTRCGPHTRILQFSSYTFDPSLYEIFTILASGGCVCVPSEQDRVNDIANFIRTHNVNTVLLTPTVSRLVGPDELPSVSLAIFGGETLTQLDIDTWTRPGRRLINCYGPTEACVIATAREILASSPSSSSSRCESSNIGHPLSVVRAWVVTPGTQQALAPVGGAGELFIEGPLLARGYLGEPERTRLSFVDNFLSGLPGMKHGRRAYRTGDWVRYRSDGSLDFLGRQDSQAKLRGQRIDVGEIEYHIHRFMSDKPDFHQASVQLHRPPPEEHRDPYLAALMAMHGPLDASFLGVPCSLMLSSSDTRLNSIATELRRKLRSVLPEYMVPSVFVALARLPTTASGKLDGAFVRAYLGQLSTAEKQGHVAQSGMELSKQHKLVRQWWSTVLGVEASAIGPDADFFALGGNSISAIRLAGAARSAGYKLQYEDIFSIPILSDMSARLSTVDSDGGGGAMAEATAPNNPQAFDLISKDTLYAVFEDLYERHGLDKMLVQDVYPCTPLQEALMAATARHRGAYVLVETIDVPRAQWKRFKQAWPTIFASFDILRTRIILGHEGGALQVVLKEARIEWDEMADVDSFVKAVYDSHDYGKPLARLAFVAAPDNSDGLLPDTVRAVFSIHHAVYDGWSLDMLWKALQEELAHDGRDESTRRTVTPFKEFMRHVLDRDTKEATEYWRERLAGLSSSVFPPRRQTVPSQHQPMATESVKHTVSLPSLETKQKHRVTMSTIAHAAWALTVSHYTANPDTLFGSTLSGRESDAASMAGAETIAGPTIASIPFRATVDYEATVSQYLAGVQQESLRAARFAHLGLEAISRIDHNCRQACQFDTLFVVQPGAAVNKDNQVQTDDLLVRRSLENRRFFPSALTVDVQPSVDGRAVAITMGYDPIVLPADMSQHILDTFATILRNLVLANQDTPVRSVAALSSEHLGRLTSFPLRGREARDSEQAALDSCLQNLVRKRVETGPFLPAVDSWDGSMTYAELDDLSTSLAEKLTHLGVGPDKAVCMLFEKSKWAVVAMLGIVKAGGGFVPLDPALPTQRLQYLVQTAGAAVILTSARHLSVCEPLQSCNAVLVNEKTLPPPTAAFLGPMPLLRVPVMPSSAAYVLFTSGSTGLPKGVVVEHGALCSSLVALGKTMDLGTHSRVLQFNAYWFDVMLLDIFGALVHGGCVCIPSEEQRINDLAGCIENFHANMTTLSTSVSRLIEPSMVPSLTTICLGGEPVLPSDVDRWASRARLVAGYGPTEACIIAVAGDLTPDTSANLIGEAVGCCCVWVVNPLKETELAPRGAVGELYIEGPNLARGYLGDDTKTAAAFIVDPPWMPAAEGPGFSGKKRPRRAFKTGDLVCFNPDGSLSYVGRRDTSQVKLRGQRVELAEIEEAIRRQQLSVSVPVAVDIFTHEERGGRQVLGAVFGMGSSTAENAGGMQELVGRLRPALAGVLPAHMIPEVYVSMPKLPALSTGKLDRKALQRTAAPLVASMLSQGTTAAGFDRQPPRTAAERLLCSLWDHVLRIGEDTTVSRGDHFFGLGGDSMSAMRLVALARHRGYPLTVAEIFRHPTLGAMAAVMQKSGDESQIDETMVDDIRDDATEATDYDTATVLNSFPDRLAPLAAQDIEAIVPCTSMQAMFLTGTETFPGAHVTQFSFSLDANLDLERLRAAVDRAAQWFPTLRTRIVRHSASGKLVQIVLAKGASASWSYFVAGDVQHVLQMDRRATPGLGDPLHRFSIVHSAKSDKASTNHLIWTMSHAAYDGWSLRMLLDCLARVYADPQYKPPQPLSYAKFARYVAGQSQDSRAFWAAHLADSTPTPLLFNYASVPDPRQDRLAIHRAVIPHGLLNNNKKATVSSLVTAAWILLLARRTQSRNITLVQLVTGRTVPLAGIETCPGPTITKLPLRVRLPPSGSPDSSITLAAVAALVRDETVRVMPHEQGGLDAIRGSMPPAWSRATAVAPHGAVLLGRFPLDLAVHPAGHLGFDGGRDIGLRRVGQQVMAPPPGPFAVECSVLPSFSSSGPSGTQIEVAVIWDSRAAEEREVEEVVAEFRNILSGCCY